MTGNAVLCGIAVLAHDRTEGVQHAAPIVAFTLGVWLSNILTSQLKHHAVRVGLSFEIASLLLLSFAPRSFPDVVFVTALALLAAYQVTSFQKVDNYAYNSTFITATCATLFQPSTPRLTRPAARTVYAKVAILALSSYASLQVQ